MKAKKAIKRLDKIGAILSDVIDRYSANGNGTLEFLDAARLSITRAKVEVNKELAPAKAEKPRRSGAKTRDGKPSAKRKGVKTETAQRLSGTQQQESKTA